MGLSAQHDKRRAAHHVVLVSAALWYA